MLQMLLVSHNKSIQKMFSFTCDDDWVNFIGVLQK